MPLPPLINNLAVITGASRGIGLAIANLFAKNGASCLLVSRSSADLQRAVDGLPILNVSTDMAGGEKGAQGGEGAKYRQVHGYVAGPVEEEGTWAEVLKWKGDGIGVRKAGESISTLPPPPAPTILINAAGITHRSLLTATSLSTIKDVINTNLIGTALACKHVSKQMIRRRVSHGVIINISSILSHCPLPGSSIYSASKAGIEALTLVLASELSQSRHPIRVNAISPGYIDTDMIRGQLSPGAVEGIPLRRLGRPEEVAKAALFLVECEYVNGVNLVVDGGLRVMGGWRGMGEGGGGGGGEGKVGGGAV
ncbi:hypothetical protein BDZ91DRAFT_851091 [Kalaharituber pfeilii]|nr:hypothetical protein BDZ91DRAFT_851091 [Kalaharituber pfeilii]